MNGYANKDDFQGRYYVIVKDEEGTYWFVNPLFPVKVTYTYTPNEKKIDEENVVTKTAYEVSVNRMELAEEQEKEDEEE